MTLLCENRPLRRMVWLSLWRFANACTVWGDLFNSPVCGFVRREQRKHDCLRYLFRGSSFSGERPFRVAEQKLELALPFPQPKNRKAADDLFAISGLYRNLCSERESNSHGFPHTPLKRARLPVPPSELEKNLSLLRWRSRRAGRSRRTRRGRRRSSRTRRRSSGRF